MSGLLVLVSGCSNTGDAHLVGVVLPVKGVAADIQLGLCVRCGHFHTGGEFLFAVALFLAGGYKKHGNSHDCYVGSGIFHSGVVY